MEGRKPSSSSFTFDLFGANNYSSAASSSAIFGSIFNPIAQGIGSESLIASETLKKHDSGNQALSAKNGVSGSFQEKDVSSGEGRNQSTTNKEMNLYHQEQKAHPFHYSSSIYYGGQDVYSRPSTAPNPCFTTFNKDGGEDESGSASRGNWWQGSLYY
ncbi:uncharacterized protein LOC142526016 [Primulina tabacum]|uniref:uncharacterized protein LOC142526016 n=1 Tax=Primulina tabacum TaxID=48773 RepID=UPI003F595E70